MKKIKFIMLALTVFATVNVVAQQKSQTFAPVDGSKNVLANAAAPNANVNNRVLTAQELTIRQAQHNQVPNPQVRADQKLVKQNLQAPNIPGGKVQRATSVNVTPITKPAVQLTAEQRRQKIRRLMKQAANN